jgi:hypothetical protein
VQDDTEEGAVNLFRFAASFPKLEAGAFGLPLATNFGDFTFSGNATGPFGESTLEGGGFATATFATFYREQCRTNCAMVPDKRFRSNAHHATRHEE